MYSLNNRHNGITRHSESPIIGREGEFKDTFYSGLTKNEDDLLDWFMNDSKNVDFDRELEAKGFIGYFDQNKFFEDSKIQSFEMEKTYPYVLQLDLSKYFENVYTHLIANIDLSLVEERNQEIFKSYLEWLDEYNQKTNDNHTKGILQGPISSKITAELLKLGIDKKIDECIEESNLKINFRRYVDDYSFYAKDVMELELLKSKSTKLFRSYELSFNETKSNLYKGFEHKKIAHFTKLNHIKVISINKKQTLTFNDYIQIREILISLMQEDDLATIKALLTKLKSNIENKKLALTHPKIIVTFILFLIKMIYVCPILSKHIFELINVISDSSNEDCCSKIFNCLYQELEYITENFADTDLEIWFFHTMVRLGNASQIKAITRTYLEKKNAASSANVIVLTVLLKQGFESNKDVLQYIFTNFTNAELCSEIWKKDWERIAQSKWWLPLSKVWILDGNVINEVQGFLKPERENLPKSVNQNLTFKSLFLDRRGNTAWDKLGMIDFLKKNAK